MSNYWLEHSRHASVEEMMLDDKAALLTLREVPEILSMLPNYTGKNILELGAGIGRFTGHLAEEAASVTAVDFMESFMDKNRELNQNHKNVTFSQSDALKLDLPDNSYDVIFTNWLLMYMTDEEVQTFFNKCLKWLKPDGHLFFRESCYHQSGNVRRTVNPTKYREPMEYTAGLHMATSPPQDKVPGGYGYEIQLSQCVDTYLQIKDNGSQICWLVKKVELPAQESSEQSQSTTFQQFLDQQQYSKNEILRYEKIFGKHFVSTGGRDTTVDFVKMLDLKAKQRVLDVGSGIGGSAFYMAETHDVEVTGIDLSYNMVSIAWERAAEINDRRILEKVGFVNVKAEDKTDLFINVLDKELKRIQEIEKTFINEFSRQDYDAIVDGWKDKQVRCGQGDQRWGLFYAEKPTVLENGNI